MKQANKSCPSFIYSFEIKAEILFYIKLCLTVHAVLFSKHVFLKKKISLTESL